VGFCARDLQGLVLLAGATLGASCQKTGAKRSPERPVRRPKNLPDLQAKTLSINILLNYKQQKKTSQQINEGGFRV